MNNKSILLAVTSDTSERSVINFIQTCLGGENLHINLCLLGEGLDKSNLVLKVAALCRENGISLRIKNLVIDPYRELEHQTAFADLLVMEKKALRSAALINEFAHNSCAIMVLPRSYTAISNILLIVDGSKQSLLMVKQFFQIFSHQIEDLDLTLLSIIPEREEAMEAKDEIMLVEYLKQYSRNVGVLKAREPLTDRLLKPVKYDSTTLVVGTANYLMSQYGEHAAFKPFYDENSSIFLPTEFK